MLLKQLENKIEQGLILAEAELFNDLGNVYFFHVGVSFHPGREQMF